MPAVSTPSRRQVLGALATAGAAVVLVPGRLARARTDTAVLATLDWPPYVGIDLPQQGWVAETVRAALALQGMGCELRFLPWTRGLREARDGVLHGVMPVYPSDRRRQEFLLTRPLPAGAIRLYVRVEDLPALSGLSHRQLSERPLGVVRDYVNPDVIDDGDIPWKRDEAGTDLLNLRKLAYGRVDLAVADELVARHLTERHAELRGRLAPLPSSLGTFATCVALHRDAGGEGLALRDALDRGLAALQAEGELLAIVERHGLVEQLGEQAAPLPPELVSPAEIP